MYIGIPFVIFVLGLLVIRATGEVATAAAIVYLASVITGATYLILKKLDENK